MSATGPDSIRDLAAGYALGALDADETRAFEAALAGSPDLAREVQECREVGALLALRAGAVPDRALRSRVLERVGHGKAATIGRPASRSGPWLGLALAAAVLVAGGFALRSNRLGERLQIREDELTRVRAELARREETLNTLLAAQGELTVVNLTATGANAPGVQFFWNRQANTAIAHAFRLPPTPAGRVYQLWVLQKGKPIPGPIFTPDDKGQALVLTFGLPAGGIQGAAVTVEPAGGSTTPTMPILLIGQITGS